MRPWPGQLEFRPSAEEQLSDSFHDAKSRFHCPASDTSPIGLSTCSFERDVAAITYEQKEAQQRDAQRPTVAYESTAQYDVFRIRITPMDSFPLMPGQGPGIILPALSIRQRTHTFTYLLFGYS